MYLGNLPGISARFHFHTVCYNEKLAVAVAYMFSQGVII
jgi:hypothetical protein